MPTAPQRGGAGGGVRSPGPGPRHRHVARGGHRPGASRSRSARVRLRFGGTVAPTRAW